MDQGVVMITGANNGIGYAMTEELLKSGYRVAGLDVSGENLEKLRESYPQTLQYCRCDVSDGQAVQRSVEAVLQSWGQIDILVNNACRISYCPFEEKDPEDTRREFEVKYFGCVNTTRAVLPHMKARGQGLIHNVSSGVGITGLPGIYGYVSTKGAIEGLTRTLALEFAPYGISVNLIHPPLTNTKSAGPLGVPPQMMADPVKVGKALARQIRSTKPVITTDLTNAIGLFMMRLFPVGMGKMLSQATARARAEQKSG